MECITEFKTKEWEQLVSTHGQLRVISCRFTHIKKYLAIVFYSQNMPTHPILDNFSTTKTLLEYCCHIAVYSKCQNYH